MNSKIAAIFSVVCLFNYGQAYYYGRCRLCRGVTSLDDCVTWQQCVDNQTCFMEEVFTDFGQKQYNGGCRDISECRNAVTGRKRDAVLVACSKCCNTDNYCNENLCGIKKATNATMCNQCDGAFVGNHSPPPKYPEDCNIRTVCNDDEMCVASTLTHGSTSLRHRTGCMKKTMCRNLFNYTIMANTQPAVVGKRDQVICRMCCGDDMCNNIACEAIKGRMVNLYTDGFLDLNTLKEIV